LHSIIFKVLASVACVCVPGIIYQHIANMIDRYNDSVDSEDDMIGDSPEPEIICVSLIVMNILILITLYEVF